MKKNVIAFLHVAYWLLYVFLWALIILLIAMSIKISKTNPLQTWHFVIFIASFGIIPAIIGFYTYYLWLFPRFLLPRKILALFVAGLLTALAAGVVSGGIIAFLFPGYSFFQEGLYSASPVFAVLCTISLLNGGMGLVIKGFITWYAEIKWKEALARRNFEMELALAKALINPHFLFNTLNNIDVLINKDSERASLYLNKLSDILRFMLYETKTEKIPLSKELQYIEKYVDLQKIRAASPNYVQYTVHGQVNDFWIEPMLFIPLVENAFKHSACREKQDAVNINIHIGANTIIFDCKNKYKEDFSTQEEYGGLGMALIQKRLNSLYPNKHTMEITKNGDTYQVKLTLHQSWKSAAS